MIRSSPSICFFCQISTLFRPQWTQVRTYAQAQRKRPSRMILSSRVSKSGPLRSGRGDNDSSSPSRRPLTPRRQKRMEFYKGYLEEQGKMQKLGDGPFASWSTTKPGKEDVFESNYPLWAPPRSERKKKANDGGLTGLKVRRPTPGPFGALNQTQARLPTPRSRAWAKNQTPPSRRSGNEKDARSPGGFHSLKMQQALATISYGARNQVKGKISDVESFEDFPLMNPIQEAVSQDALKDLDNVAPTPIQRLAIPELMGLVEGKKGRRAQLARSPGMQQFLLAAETGSGKTMAYLLPAIDAMKRAENEDMWKQKAEEARQEAEKIEKSKQGGMFELDPPEIETSNAGRPRVIVLVPTAELVDQVGALAKALSHKVKFRAAPVSSNYSSKVIKNRLFSPIDVLISTPHLLATVAETEPNLLSRVTHLIIDEADSLFDRSFSPTTSAIIDKSRPSLQQLVLCSATIPKRLDNYLRERFPDIKRLTTPNLHAIPRRVQLGVVDVEKDPYRGNKDLACADVIWKIGSSGMEPVEDKMESIPAKRLIVFVNEREKSVELAEYLVRKGIDAAALNRDLESRNQADLLGEFCTSDTPLEELKQDKKPKSNMQRLLKNTKVLVCTDIASRGIDTTAVRHVILYDVPHTSIDFIHRLGRTGRMGRRGRGIVLVGKKDRKDVVKEIREAMFKGAALI